jgi:hypothetical protein
MTADHDAQSERRRLKDKTETHTGLLLLPDGRILVHNLTPAMAHILQQLDPGDRILRERQQSIASGQAGDSDSNP